jgi:hypothetical protein
MESGRGWTGCAISVIAGWRTMAIFKILTKDGVADPGQEQLLSGLVAELQKPDAKLLLHLHGGLVDQASGEALAHWEGS